MDKEKINSFLAEWQGLKRGVDFDCQEIWSDGTIGDYKPAPDYCTNAMSVLEKLAELKQPIAIDYYSSEDYGDWVSCHSLNIAVKADTIHEAICRAAVALVKAQEVGR